MPPRHSAIGKHAWSVGVTASYCHRATAPGPNRRGLLVRQCLNGHSHNARTCTVSWCDGVLLSPSHSARRKHAWSIGVTVSYYQRVTALEESMRGLLVYQCLIIKGSQRWKKACMVYWCNNVLLAKGHSAGREHAWSIGVTVSYYQRVTALEESMRGL